jgi:predicted ferric reductase
LKGFPTKFLAPALFFGNLAVLFTLWWHGGGIGLRGGTVGEVLIALGDLLGLLAFYLMMWQMLFIGRIGWIERYSGHDKLSYWHHLMGLTAISLLALHPIILTIGYSREAETTLVSQFLLFLTNYEDVLNAFIAYVMFMLIVGISLYIVRKRLQYEVWYSVHFLLYAAIFLAFEHQFHNGHDFARPWVRTYWEILFYGTIANVIWYRFLAPLWRSWRHGFHIEAIVPETHNVTSVIIGGKNIDQLKARAGQFVIVRFLVRGWWWESHPFSLSEMPSGKRLRLSIKNVGDYTSTISRLPVGTNIILEGPLGRFTADRAIKSKVLLIAGGIGITPLRSLFEEFAKAGRTVDLIYAAQSEQDFALKRELDALANSSAHVHYIPQDIMGRLTPEIIKASVPDVADRDVFLCGPPPMMKAVRQQLESAGVPKQHVMYEKFQLG